MRFGDQDTLIVASDGLWDARSNEDVMTRIAHYDDFHLALSGLVEEMKMEGILRDNISIVLLERVHHLPHESVVCKTLYSVIICEPIKL